MVELLRYLEANGFATFIASGGDRDFMRSISTELYGIPPERVIGSSYGLVRETRTTGSSRRRRRDVRRRAGEAGADLEPDRRDAGAGGRQLERGHPDANVRYATGLRLLILHDDAEREFEYTTGAEDALAQDLTVVSVKRDWTTVFAERP